MAFWTAAAIIGSSVLSGYSNKRSQDKQADAANDQREKQFEYDNELYAMGTDKLKADYAFAYETYELRKKNEEKLAKYTDESNTRRYNYDLKIVKSQNEANKKAYQKSEFLYGQQLNFNRMAADDAAEEALVKQQEINQEVAFQNEDAIIKSIEAQGQLAVISQSGASSAKAAQSLVAAKGRNEAQLIESLFSANRSTYMTLKSISRDKYGADLAAFANKMLEPGVVPDPLKPIPTPIADFQPPRALEEYDFGPEPIKGAKAVGGSWLSVAASAVSGVAGAAKAGAITGPGW
tara:strand:- start:1572 stop:2447 length:876 start_codon:yes stop_codon:yes gene_type:complete